MARIVRFQPPTTAHLSKRLRDICDLEGMKADSKSLTTLIEASDGDIRNCLNTLQIIRRQTDNLDVRIIKQTALGLKDTSTSVLATWDKLFKIPAKKRLKGIGETFLVNRQRLSQPCIQKSRPMESTSTIYCEIFQPVENMTSWL